MTCSHGKSPGVAAPLAGNFARSYFVSLAPSDAAFQRFVEMEHPDVVVEEHAERTLRYIPPPPAPPDAITDHLSKSGAVPAHAVERINGMRADPKGMTIGGGELRITGWAIDPLSAAPASPVEIAIDGVPHPAA